MILFTHFSWWNAQIFCKIYVRRIILVQIIQHFNINFYNLLYKYVVDTKLCVSERTSSQNRLSKKKKGSTREVSWSTCEKTQQHFKTSIVVSGYDCPNAILVWIVGYQELCGDISARDTNRQIFTRWKDQKVFM